MKKILVVLFAIFGFCASIVFVRAFSFDDKFSAIPFLLESIIIFLFLYIARFSVNKGFFSPVLIMGFLILAIFSFRFYHFIESFSYYSNMESSKEVVFGIVYILELEYLFFAAIYAFIKFFKEFPGSKKIVKK